MTETEIAERSARAVRAAAGAARELGLTVTDPVPLYDVFSVVVDLRPAPVVARVPTVLPRTVAADPDGQAAQQRRELAVAGWLAGRGHPVVRPAPGLPTEPVRRDGYSITFWERVEELPGAEADGAGRAALAARLHAALRDYPEPLLWLVPLDESIPDGLEQLAHRPDLLDPADLARARRDWAGLEPLARDPAEFARAFPGLEAQPVHGDAPTYNVIPTPDGELSSDFEHVGRAPVEWDMAFVDAEGRAAYDAEARRLGLRPLDERLLRTMETGRMLQLVAALAMTPQLPMLAEGLAPWLEQWRAGRR